MASEKYNYAARNLIKAIDIAIEVIKANPPKGLNQQHVKIVLESYNGFKESLVNPNPKFSDLGSLKYKVQDLFTYFQEASGETVNEFWKKIKEAGLPYERENRIEKLLKRGKIRNQMDFDYVIDTIVPLQQEGVLSNDDVEQLNKMITHYENRKK